MKRRCRSSLLILYMSASLVTEYWGDVQITLIFNPVEQLTHIVFRHISC
ncbi:Uncharacterised protein [Vibrio cholerae]|nr:Uncharacterised protein [Vibrio cholerae]